MSLIDDLSQTHNWCSTRVEYKGHGRAEFSHPKGYVEGSVTVTFDEMGRRSVTMQVENIESDRELQLGLNEFLSGRQPVKDGNAVQLDVGLDYNSCTRLEITTPDGTYITTGEEVFYGHSQHFLSNSNEAILRFHPGSSRFDAVGAGNARYWVLPLTNFVTEFTYYRGGVDNHPLRLRNQPELPELPDDLPQDQVEVARLWAWANQPVILFGWKERLCFIEALPDYGARKSCLTENRHQRLVTAVMVGEVDGDGVGIDALENLVPVDALRALGFATGVEVGAPWLELRDETGAWSGGYIPTTADRCTLGEAH